MPFEIFHTSPSNTPRSRTHGAIALGATGNAGGAFYFMSLASSDVISQHQWTVCPIQEEVVRRLEVLAIKDKQPLIQSTGLVVKWGQVMSGTPHMNVQDGPRTGCIKNLCIGTEFNLEFVVIRGRSTGHYSFR